ncbi:MAG TPA: GlcNAc-PI de-N-acetylase, partial [Spirochaetia bacterium]|nr:GlcNAc-PI de-N-acetylase [Spirochaetia bacterium]
MNIMIVGAHPDDPDLFFGGASLLYSGSGHRIMMVSMTNGNAGHHKISKKILAQRRK